MGTDIEREEVEALVGSPGEGQAAPRVTERDFSKPQRLGPERIAEIQRHAARTTSDLERSLGEAFGKPYGVGLTAVREANAEEVYSPPEDPPAMARFSVGGQPAWIVWENRAAVSAVEGLLGSPTPTEEPRELRGVERDILLKILTAATGIVTESLGIDAGSFEFVRAIDSIGTWEDGGEGADAHRVRIELSLECGEEMSALVLFLPGFGPPAAGDGEGPPAALPVHLGKVEVDVGAAFVECEIPLSELLQLEEGDVIPLGSSDEPIRVRVEGLEVARARLGRNRGRFAVSIIETKNDPGEDAPTSKNR
ncbi:MAG: FliM/FliN family flagellar motor switch protein [Planctomycetota bacterium]|nr:FliM/FliN family flagellar motor switch protein [Planctomycetota bacterium]